MEKSWNWNWGDSNKQKISMEHELHGFFIYNKKGQGFKRWINDDTLPIFIEDNLLMPYLLNRILIAQDVMNFDDAFSNAKSAAHDNDLNFSYLGEQEYKSYLSLTKCFLFNLKKAGAL